MIQGVLVLFLGAFSHQVLRFALCAPDHNTILFFFCFKESQDLTTNPSCVQRLFDNWKINRLGAGPHGKRGKLNNHGAPVSCTRCAHHVCVIQLQTTFEPSEAFDATLTLWRDEGYDGEL